MTRRHATIVVLALAVLGLACVDLSAPNGPAAISLVQLPAGFVVRGDVMRDSAGNPAQPTITAFNANGKATGNALSQFFILDSNPAAHFNTSGILVGDRLGIVNFIGQVGGLQTPSTQVPVTVAPTTLDQGAGALDTIKAQLSTDTTLALPIGQGASLMPVLVAGVGDTGVQGVVIHYAITRTLASSDPNRAAVYITVTGTGGTVLANTDTTTAPPDQGSGAPANRAQINVKANLLADLALATGQKVDSIIVTASAFYRGMPLAGTPVTFVFQVTGVIGTGSP